MACPAPTVIEEEIFSVNRARATRMLAGLVEARASSYCIAGGADCVPTYVVLDYDESIRSAGARTYWWLWIKMEVTCIPRVRSRWEIIIDAIMRGALIVIGTIGAILTAPIAIRYGAELLANPAKARPLREIYTA